MSPRTGLRLFWAGCVCPGVDTPDYMMSPPFGAGVVWVGRVCPGVDTPGYMMSPRSGLGLFGSDAFVPALTRRAT